MATAIFITSTILFFVIALVVQVEERTARRFIGGQFRDKIDVRLGQLIHRFDTHWKHLSKYILQLGWYYSIHSLLRTVLTILVSVYDRIERIFEHNRSRTKQLRKELKRQLEKTHLTHIAEHKAKVSLSKEEQERLKTEKLEQNH